MSGQEKENLEWIQRVEALCLKIGEIKESEFSNEESRSVTSDKLVSIRIRSAKNLLFKLSVLKEIPDNNNEPRILNNFLIKKIIDSVNNCLKIIFCNLNFSSIDISAPDNIHLLSLLISILNSVFQFIEENQKDISSDIQNSYSLLINNFKDICGTVYLKDGQDNLVDSIEKLVELICASSITIKRSTVESMDENETSRLLLEPLNIIHVGEPNIRHNINNLTKGAGAILNSYLVYKGWKFPVIFLTESDEKYLFNLEVKLKLLHETAYSELMSVLFDFPPQLLLQRTGLIHAVLDIVGSPSLSLTDLDLGLEGLNPINCIQWLNSLILKCKNSFKVLMEGSMCSSIPIPNGDNFNKRNESIAAKLTQEMNIMKYPMLNSNHQLDMLSNDVMANNIANLSLSPVPSFSGLVFGTLAASLPLLQSKNSKAAIAILTLVNSCIGYILEPINKENDVEPSLAVINMQRLQHILNRFEQIFGIYDDLFDVQKFLEIINLDSINSDNKDDLVSHSFDLVLSSIFVKLMELVHPCDILPFNENKSDNGTKLYFGSLTRDFICKLLSSNVMKSLLPDYSNILINVLKVLDPEMESDIFILYNLVFSTKFFEGDFVFEKISSNEFLKLSLYNMEIVINSSDIVTKYFDDGKFEIFGNLFLILIGSFIKKDKNIQENCVVLLMKCLLLGSPNISVVVLKSIVDWLNGKYNSFGEDENDMSDNAFERSLFSILRLSEPSGDLKYEILSSLCTLKMINLLLMISYFQCNAVESNMVLKHLSVHLIEILFTFLNSYETSQEIDNKEWSSLLFPLNILIQTELYLNVEIDKTIPSTLKFKAILEDFCVNSDDPTIQDSFHRSLIMGIFNNDPIERSKSAVLIRHYITKDHSVKSFSSMNASSIVSHDPFPPSNSIISLTDTVTQADRTKKDQISISSKFTHTDTYKMVNIVLGNFDSSIKLTSLTQLILIFSTDKNILITSDKKYIIRTSNALINNLESILLRISESSSSITQSELSLGVEIAKLISIFVIKFPGIQNNIGFQATSEEDYISFKILIALVVNDEKSVEFQYKDFHSSLKLIFSQLIHTLVFSSERLFVTLKDYYKEELLSVSSIDDDTGTYYIKIPKFLVPVYKFVIEANESTSEIINQSFLISLMTLKIKLSDSVSLSYPSFNIPQVIFEEIEIVQDDNSVHIGTVTKLFDVIANADSHSSLRTAVNITNCVGLSYEPLYGIFLELDLSLFTAISNIILNLPKSLKDYLTLSKCLVFLDEILINYKNKQDFKIVREFYDEIYEMILSSLVYYFKENSDYLWKNITIEDMPESRRKEYEIINSAIQYDYLKLLLTLITFKFENLEGKSHAKYIVGLLIFLSKNESIAMKTRIISLKVLEAFINNKNFAYLFNDLSDEECEINSEERLVPYLIDSLIKIVKVLRIPDSFRTTSVVISGLRVLLALIISDRNFIKSLQSYSDKPWGWLSRFLYDRRAEIKLLSIEIICLVLEGNKTCDEDSATLDPNSSFKWPPYEQLTFIVTDNTESKAVRVSAIRVLVNAIRSSNLNNEDNNYHGNINVTSIISGICDCLSTTDTVACITSIKDSITALVKLVNGEPQQKFISNIFLLMRSMKVVPALIELLNPNFESKLLSTTLRRLNFSSNSFLSDVDVIHDAKNKYYKSNVDGPFKDLTKYNYLSTIDHQIIIEKITRFVLSIDENDRISFEQCLRYTSCVIYLISNIVTMGEKLNLLLSNSEYDYYEIGFDFHVFSFASQLNLFNLILTKEYRDKYLDIHLKNNELLPLQMIKSALIFLQAIYDEKIYFARSSIHLISSVCDMLSVMIDIPIWRANLGLGGPYRNCPINNLTMYLFEIILTFRLTFHQNMNVIAKKKTLEKDINLLNEKLDFLILLFLQNSYRTRAFFINFTISDDAINNSPAEEVIPRSFDNLFRYYLSIISEAENILCPSNPVVATLKKDSDRWRDKTRGYVHRNIKKSINVSNELQEPLKKNFFLSLLILSQVLPDNYEGQVLAFDLNLHLTLNNLLKFSVKYSLSSNVDHSSRLSVPSNCQLSVAIYSLCCSFIYQNTETKNSFGSTGQTPLNMVDKSFGNTHTQLDLSTGNTLHKLLTVGINKGCIPSMRSLCLSILGSIVNIEAPILPSLKNALILSTLQCLQTSTHLSTVDKEIICYLLNVLTSFIHNQGGGLLIYSTISGSDSKDRNLDNSKMKLLPLIDLLQSIWEMVKSNQNPLYSCSDIAAAVCRCIGSICMMNKNTQTLNKRTISSALSEKIAVILSDGFKSDNKSISNSALIPLWYISHDSEKVKCLVKEELIDFQISQEVINQTIDNYNDLGMEEKGYYQHGFFYLDTRIIDRAKINISHNL